MKFFFPPYSTNQINERYKELALIIHPDKGGSDELMKLLNLEKEKALSLVRPIPKTIKVLTRRRKLPGAKKVTHVHLNINVKEATNFLKEVRRWWKD